MQEGDEPDIIFDEWERRSIRSGFRHARRHRHLAERAKAQSEEYGHSLEREIGFLFVHGFLHLLGYDHQTAEEEAVMFAKQEAISQQAGLTR